MQTQTQFMQFKPTDGIESARVVCDLRPKIDEWTTAAIRKLRDI